MHNWDFVFLSIISLSFIQCFRGRTFSLHTGVSILQRINLIEGWYQKRLHDKHVHEKGVFAYNCSPSMGCACEGVCAPAFSLPPGWGVVHAA